MDTLEAAPAPAHGPTSHTSGSFQHLTPFRFTSANAREMALKAAAARALRQAGKTRAKALEADSAEQFRADLLTSLRGQVQRLGRLIARETDGRKLIALAEAQGKLASQVRDLTEPRSSPVSRKPAPAAVQPRTVTED